MKPAAPQTQEKLIEGDGHAIAEGVSDLFVELKVEVNSSTRNAKIWAHTRTFGDLELLHTNVVRGGFSVSRTRELVATSSSNVFFIGCIFQGDVTFTQESRTISLKSSDLAVLDSTRPYRIDVRDHLDVLWIRVPRHRIEGRMPGSVDILAQRVDGSEGAGHLASSLISATMRKAEQISVSESLRVGNAILDLLSLSLDVNLSQGESRPLHILRRIQNYIDANISNPALCRESIANSHGISSRYLSKIFEREGLTVARWIRLRRLELSRQRIETHDSDTPISDIAFACGFSDVSSFNRAFKKQFGATPSSLRRDRRSGAGN